MTTTPRWRLDRRIPPAVLMALALQFIALVAWSTQLQARVALLEQSQGEAGRVPERLARLEERLGAVREDVSFIRRTLERR